MSYKVSKFSTVRFICNDIDAQQTLAVATLYKDNPDYWSSIAGSVPTAAMAGQDLVQSVEGKFPKLGLYDAQQTLIGVCYLGCDFLAPHVWHIEFFLVSEALRGSGASTEIFAGLEQWIHSQGGQWLRLGCVTTDERALRFWNKQGFTDLGIWQGRILDKPVNLQLKWKSLSGGSLADYFQVVPNDRVGYEA
jgi:GNAT superfamily N-acetyltransferase